MQSLFLIVMSVGLYGVFLAIQTRRHRDYFVGPAAGRHGRRKGHGRDRGRADHPVLLLGSTCSRS